ncbi:GntR family transcriptional regulator [Azospirillum canadense]|uniref:GntR family transcriptional regulator n=1 Tax=Azospirillum canadense TaxID=403962 RepID=UPI0022262334|nr:GntR family transcriptional regulator [Azospirillum canadense]MCW2240504.1 DNA-binding GntR family transcriptional regulator [Azospirillum canadense]
MRASKTVAKAPDETTPEYGEQLGRFEPAGLEAAMPRGKSSRSMAQKAYNEIKALILSNELQGGAHILEEELASMLGMSRTPLREALVQLQNEGHIQIVPRRGIRVVPLTINDLKEIYDILQALEAHAAESISQRADRKEITAHLSDIVDEMRAALAADDLDRWAKANERFHRDLVMYAGNGRLEQFCRTLLDQSHRVRVFTLRLRKPPIRSTENHAELVKAMRDGNADLAHAIHVAHKNEWLAEMQDIIERLKITRL